MHINKEKKPIFYKLILGFFIIILRIQLSTCTFFMKHATLSNEIDYQRNNAENLQQINLSPSLIISNNPIFKSVFNKGDTTKSFAEKFLDAKQDITGIIVMRRKLPKYPKKIRKCKISKKIRVCKLIAVKNPNAHLQSVPNLNILFKLSSSSVEKKLAKKPTKNIVVEQFKKANKSKNFTNTEESHQFSEIPISARTTVNLPKIESLNREFNDSNDEIIFTNSYFKTDDRENNGTSKRRKVLLKVFKKSVNNDAHIF